MMKLPCRPQVSEVLSGKLDHLDGLTRLPHGIWRQVQPEETGTGHAEYVVLEPGLFLGVERIANHLDYIAPVQGDGNLLFHLRLTGKSYINYADVVYREIQPTSFCAFVHPVGAIASANRLTGEEECTVLLYCDPQLLTDNFTADTGVAQATLTNAVGFETGNFFYADLPIGVELMAAAQALSNCPFSGPRRTLYFKAKGLEIFCWALRALENLGAGSVEKLSERDIVRLETVKSALTDNFSRRPTILELARQVGMSETVLCEKFKKQFGMTVFEHLQSVRMGRARELLENTEMSITEIAFEVGYEYATNFSTAFKREFGVTPKSGRFA